MFELEKAYTRKEISAQVGGGLISFLPTKNGKVVAACITPEMNPFAPKYIIAGTGKVITKSAEILSQQKEAIPIFIKRRPNEWVFQGNFRVINTLREGATFKELATSANRDLKEVRFIIELENC